MVGIWPIPQGVAGRTLTPLWQEGEHYPYTLLKNIGQTKNRLYGDV